MGGLCQPYDCVTLDLDPEFDIKMVNSFIHSKSQQIFLSAHYMPGTCGKAIVLILSFLKKSRGARRWKEGL